MKKQANTFVQKNKYKLIAVVAAAVTGAILLRLAAAGTGQFLLSPSTTKVQKGADFTIAVNINPGTEIDGVDVTLTYDSNVLEFVSIDTSNSVFPLKLAESGGGGQVRIVRGILGSKISDPDSHIANVTFKALTHKGSTTITASGNATNNGSYTDPGSASATVEFSTPGGNKSTPPGKDK